MPTRIVCIALWLRGLSTACRNRSEGAGCAISLSLKNVGFCSFTIFLLIKGFSLWPIRGVGLHFLSLFILLKTVS